MLAWKVWVRTVGVTFDRESSSLGDMTPGGGVVSLLRYMALRDGERTGDVEYYVHGLIADCLFLKACD